MAVSLDSSTHDNLNKISTRCRISPSCDKKYWSSLRNRVDTLLENRSSFDNEIKHGECDGVKTMKSDSLLLLKGFDFVSNSLTQLSKNLDNALQGARDLAKLPTLSDIYHSAVEQAKSKEIEVKEEVTEEENENVETKRGQKRKIEEDDSQNEHEKIPKDGGKLKKAKNLAIAMATKAASLARELKSVKSEMYFMQKRCDLLEEENRRLRDGFSEGIRPEEDDLVRLQLEALLAEKSRLANENANLTRENQCLHQLVEYHQRWPWERAGRPTD